MDFWAEEPIKKKKKRQQNNQLKEIRESLMVRQSILYWESLSVVYLLSVGGIHDV